MEQKTEKWVVEHEIAIMERDGKTWFRVRDVCNALNLVSTYGFVRGLDEREIYRESRGGSTAKPAWITPETLLRCLDARQRWNRPLNSMFRQWITQWIALDMATRPKAAPAPAARKAEAAARRQKYFDDLAKAPKGAPQGLMDDIKKVLNDQGITAQQLLVAALALSESMKLSAAAAPADL